MRGDAANEFDWKTSDLQGQAQHTYRRASNSSEAVETVVNLYGTRIQEAGDYEYRYATDLGKTIAYNNVRRHGTTPFRELASAESCFLRL